MAALVQSFPQQSSTVTMLHTRPSSASGILQNAPAQGQNHNQYISNSSQMNRNSYHGMSSGTATTYRGQTSVTPIAPYAFTSTPNLNGFRSPGPYLHSNQRTSSAPTVPTIQTPDVGYGSRSRYPAAASISTTSSSSSSELSAVAQRTATSQPRPQSTINTTPPMLLSPPATPSPTSGKAPDRYRRPNNRRAESAGTGTIHQQDQNFGSSMVSGQGAVSVNNVFAQTVQIPPFQTSYSNQGFTSQGPSTSTQRGQRSATDDLYLPRQSSQDENTRYRRRSIHTIDAVDFNAKNDPNQNFGHQHPLRSSPVLRPISSPETTRSYESINSHGNQQRPSSAAKRDSIASANPAPPAKAADAVAIKRDQPQLVNIPPRASSSDATKRIASSSPLSKPMTMSADSPVSKDSFASAVNAALQGSPTASVNVTDSARPQSPAAKQLAALNEKENKKSKTSRLRRAFSFGSAAELRKASIEKHATVNSTNAAERSRLRKEQFKEEQDAEQARIAQQQEAGGLGSGIYSGQGNYYTGSTDNLSISSTASSASIMIRKMGKGMKKSTRSLVGLFRPKSVIGVPAADSAFPEPSLAQVSRVTVEAERERVNVNANPHDQVGGGTGYPKLERNSLDAASAAAAVAAVIPANDSTSTLDSSAPRRSIVGGEKERAEVLAAVKKGILKRAGTDSGSSSPTVRAVDSKTPNFNLPLIPSVNDSPPSSAPPTPNDESQGHRRTGSVALSGEDYFMSALKFRGESKTAPGTPTGTLKRNATFSPRIQFHDTWPSGEYDRRGEIATCNRLTPMLAQQIKEELNTFKMEMEVHENSKIYTHFF